MKYKVLIINSIHIYDYVENSASGITYYNLDKCDVDRLTELSLEQNFSVVIQKYEEEE